MKFLLNATNLKVREIKDIVPIKLMPGLLFKRMYVGDGRGKTLAFVEGT
jgi:hypothetical protein